MKKNLISIWILLFLAVTFVTGQTRREQLEKKYGKPISEKENTEEFYIRKDIILKVNYDDKELPVEYLIFPTRSLNSIEKNLSYEIKEEIIPAKERIGKPINMSFNSGCGGIDGERYRNLNILTYGSCNGIVKIEIKFGKFGEGVRIISDEDL